MSFYRVRKIATGLMVGALVLGLVGYLFAQSSATFSIGLCVATVGCIVGYWVVRMKFWRCPKCEVLLPMKQHFYSVKHCPECGKELDLSRW